ncbi:MAG: phosphoribosylamine--glycine ligase [Candidatus Thermoplasmatota archaeon]
MKVLTVGGGAREHTIVKALAEDGAEIYAAMGNKNPGIARSSEEYLLESGSEIEKIVDWAEEKGVEMAVVGPEAPLGEGIVDALEEKGIRCASPNQAAAKIETSKEFMRDLQSRYGLPGRVEYESFDDMEEIEDFLSHYEGELAVKPVGLTGGKGVKVMGEHLENKKEVIDYCEKVLEEEIGGKPRLVLEERLKGEEYTLQVFTDGENLIPMPLVQDHKRLFEGDEGPNTGGMGSYSQADGLLPFLDQSVYDESVDIIKKTLEALKKDGRPYKGVLYGQFMLTAEGPKIVEFNCRWGDPEAMNVLPLLETNYVDLCKKIAEGDISDIDVSFENKSSVCKYIVPEGYGVDPNGGHKVEVDERSIEDEGAQLYFASVDEKDGEIYTTTSRAMAVVGYSEELEDAEATSERALDYVKGDKIQMRHDIGKPESIQRKVDNMKKIRGEN